MAKVLLHHDKIATSIKGAVAYRIRYASYDMNGVPTESTGLVIAPDAPGDNRRVMSWAHGTTGIGDASCPSAQPDPACELTLYFAPGSTTQIDYGVPGLQKSIDEGWVVVATDYQGIGTPGVHQYTVNRTNAIDCVTIVHAARELPVGAGTKFGVVGWSQGGGAAAATVELDPADYGELEIVGTACMSPGVPIIALKSPGLGSAVGGGGPIPPDDHLFMILAGTAAAFPDTLSLDDVFTPVGKKVFDAGWNTQGTHHLADSLSRAFKHEGPVMAIDQSKLPAWFEAFTQGSATLRKPVAPVLVLRDAQDDNGPCPTPWQLGYIEAVKALGGDITETVYPACDHFALPAHSIDHSREWLASKF